MPDTTNMPGLAPFRPVCGHCGTQAVVHWLRRPGEAEHANILGAHQQLAAEALAAADPRKPPPVIGPAPTPETSTVSVYACATHAIHLDAAARVHAAGCSAPNPDHLPQCDCEPEPLPAPVELHPTVTLPTGWVVSAQS
jgi:hypothetical protein